MDERLILNWGNPKFLYPYWLGRKLKRIKSPTVFDYRQTLPGLSDLFYQYNSINRNIEYDNHNIVIGNGATQILNALFALVPSKVISTPAPFFSRFKKFAEINNKSFLSIGNHELVNLITTPNNPDGKTNLPNNWNTIYDLSYNWGHFTTNVQSLNEDIMVFSFAKAFGMPSIRIGWAYIRDKELAKDVEEYIEYTTAGVSILSQEFAKIVLQDQLNTQSETVIEYGRDKLRSRWNIINDIRLPFEVTNESGMFLLCKGDCPKTINALSGPEFGMSDEYFRLNLGCSDEEFNKFLGIVK